MTPDVADALAVGAGRVGRGRGAHVEVEERVAVGRAGRLQRADQRVALEAERREEVRLGGRPAERRRRVDDVATRRRTRDRRRAVGSLSQPEAPPPRTPK